MKNKWLVYILLGFACALGYVNMLGNDFVWDDKLFIPENYFIRDFSNITRVFMIDFWEGSLRSFKTTFYRPLINASFLIDYAVWKLNPVGYHLTNLLFHFGVTALVYLVAGLFFSPASACICGLLFAVHPVHVESVTFICGRTDVFAAFFMLIAFYLFVLYIRQDRYWRVIVSAVMFLFAMFCKEASVILFVLLAVVWFFESKKTYSIKKIILLSLPYIVCLGVYIIMRKQVYAGPIKYYGTYPADSMLYTWLTMPKIIMSYIGKLFVPINLSIDYAPAVVTSFLSLWFIVPVAGVLIVLGSGIFAYFSGRRWLAFGLCWFFVGLAPVLNIVPIGIFMADRFLYIPSVGFVLVCGYFVNKLLHARRKQYIFIIGLVLLCMLVLTIRRNIDWHNEMRLWRKTVRTTPASYRAHGSLGQIYLKQKMYEAALRETKLANLLNPNDNRVVGNLGVIYMDLQQYDKAAYYFEQSKKLDSHDFRTHANLFIVYAYLNENEKALMAINEAIRISPGNPQLWLMKAGFYKEHGVIDRAHAVYEQILRRWPDNQEALFSLGVLYKDAYKDYAKAMQLFQRILKIDPRDKRIHDAIRQTMILLESQKKE